MHALEDMLLCLIDVYENSEFQISASELKLKYKTEVIFSIFVFYYKCQHNAVNQIHCAFANNIRTQKSVNRI